VEVETAAASPSGLWNVSTACTIDRITEPSGLWNVSTACTIDRITETGDAALRLFQQRYKGRRPVVFSTGAANAAVHRQFAKQELLSLHSSVPVVLSSSNSHAKHKQRTTLGVSDQVAVRSCLQRRR
jgi:hypothetical protein